MGKTIQIKRGPKNTMPTLAQGELGMTTDSGAEGLFIGTGTKNIEMARKSDLNISGQISTHNSNSSAHSDIRKSVTTHTGNTSIHVTAEEKNAWNAKLDSYTETDPTVPAWAKAKSKPSYTASEVGAVPTSRKVNGKALSSDITLSASDVGARPSSWTPSASDVGAVPTSRTVNGKALSSDITLSASDVGLGNVGNFKAVSTVASQGLTTTEKSNARANIGAGTSSLTIGTTASTAAAGNHTHTASEVGAVPTSRKVNGKALSADITLSASDVGAVPTSRTVNGKALSANITLSASDVGAAPASHAIDTDIHVTAEEKAKWNDSDVFIAKYGTTSYAEVEEAYKSGKLLFCEKDTCLMPINTALEGQMYIFLGIYVDSITVPYIDSSGWHSSEAGFDPASHASTHASDGIDPITPASIGAAPAPFKPSGKSYLTFSSPNSFTLKVNDATKHWDGTLEYFASDKTWTTWDGTTTLTAVENDGEHVLYLRGTWNTVITGNSNNYKWVLTGSDIACIGNIENLLDYSTVKLGALHAMADYCYSSMFYGCTSLTKAPDLPATTLAKNCYSSMFYGCTGLTQAPALPATTLAEGCYFGMFTGCTSLTQAPALPATRLVSNCYTGMFAGCTSLTQAPALPATTLASSCYSYMFKGCTKLRLSSIQTGEYTQKYHIPMSGTGTTATDALTEMFTGTGGTFTGTPEINTTYYLRSDNMIVHDTEVATLRGYVSSMIDAVHSYGTEDLEAGTSSLETGKLYFVYE